MAKVGEWGKCITYKIVDAEKFYNEYDKGNVGTMAGLELVEGKTSAPLPEVKEADVLMECERTESDFSELELVTGMCKHECYCELKGGCPLVKLMDEYYDKVMEV